MAAELGDQHAIDLLAAEPCYDPGFEYLADWAKLLYGRSGVGMAGVVPVAPTQIKAWAELTQQGELHPWEVEAVILLDAALRAPDEEEAESLPSIQNYWPERKK